MTTNNRDTYQPNRKESDGIGNWEMVIKLFQGVVAIMFRVPGMDDHKPCTMTLAQLVKNHAYDPLGSRMFCALLMSINY